MSLLIQFYSRLLIACACDSAQFEYDNFLKIAIRIHLSLCVCHK